MAPPHPFAARWNHNSRWYPRIAELVSGKPVILDVGCGDGTLTRYLAKNGHQVIGLDNDPNILGDDVEDVHFMLGDAVSLPFENDSFDAVVCVMALHHTHSELALVEMRRVLKPGGKLIICGTAKDRSVGDFLRSLIEIPESLYRRIGKKIWWQNCVEVDPTRSWKQTRELIAEMLPSSKWQRLWSWRYLVVWERDS